MKYEDPSCHERVHSMEYDKYKFVTAIVLFEFFGLVIDFFVDREGFDDISFIFYVSGVLMVIPFGFCLFNLSKLRKKSLVSNVMEE